MCCPVFYDQWLLTDYNVMLNFDIRIIRADVWVGELEVTILNATVNCVAIWLIFWLLNTLGRGLKGSTAFQLTEYTVNYVTLLLLYVGRPGQTSQKRLLLLWTKVAMMLDWGSSTLDITTAGIFGTAHCWYGFVYCTVLMLAVLTDGRWKLAATYCKTIRCHHCGMVL